MDGDLSAGTDEISTAEILRTFAFAPTSMTVEMHMLTRHVCAYGPALTSRSCCHTCVKDMDMRPREGSRIHSSTVTGIGDLQPFSPPTQLWQTSESPAPTARQRRSRHTYRVYRQMDGFPLEYPDAARLRHSFSSAWTNLSWASTAMGLGLRFLVQQFSSALTITIIASAIATSPLYGSREKFPIGSASLFPAKGDLGKRSRRRPAPEHHRSADERPKPPGWKTPERCYRH